MTEKNLFVFGYGFSAGETARTAKSKFATVFGTTRSSEKTTAIAEDGVTPILFGGDEGNAGEISSALEKTTHLLISIGPNEAGDPVLNACSHLLKRLKNLQWIGYLSTVGVYGNHDGEWVNEETTCKPVSKRSVQRVAAENAWQAFADAKALPLGIFRLSGIYGPGRNAFRTIEAGRSRRLVKKDQVFNRIHRADIAQAVNLAMEKDIGGIFNITDHEPAPPQDVVTYAHELMGREPPATIDFETADLTPMARSFYGENKRVSNKKSIDVLGMTYAYPDYRTSLKRMWDEGTW